MSDQDWVDNNDHYLAASLQWLRWRLQALMPAAPANAAASTPAPSTVAAPAVVIAPAHSWFSPKASALPKLSAPSLVLDASPAASPMPGEAQAARDAAAQTDPPPALILLAQHFGLSDFERDVLLMCAAAEIDPDICALFAAAQGNGSRGYPSFALARQVLDDRSWDPLSLQRPLRYARLVEFNASPMTPIAASAMRADERVVNYIKGINVLDERLALLLTPPLPRTEPALAETQAKLARDLLQCLHDAPESQVMPVQLLGTDPACKYAVARKCCAELKRQLYRATVTALPTAREEVENLARLWQRDSVLLPVALYLDAEEFDTAAPEAAAALRAFLTREPGLVFVGLREAVALDGGSGHVLEVGRPSASEQCQAWQAVLEPALQDGAALSGARLLAGQFDLDLDAIRTAASAALASAGEAPLADEAWVVCRDMTRPRLDALAQRLDPKATWADLVLPPEALHLLKQIAPQVRYRYQVHQTWGYAKRMSRGLGVSVLFAGESGTGKTMAAEVIANELRLNLYRIDLSAVVSKYIGETEKNLRRLFDAAEQGGAILLFDEADALFGKRSEVKDSHDRYANIEINYLLQRMESFGGLAILATNMKSALDPAFLRRLRFIVNFPFPGAAERQLIWDKVFPEAVKGDGIDVARLSRFNLSGGNIQSIALNAAFTAAGRPDQKVTQPMLMSAVRAELRKLDKQINEAEFR